MLSKGRVLVVEDDTPGRFALERSLEADGYEVRAEASGQGIDKVLERFRPHLALLDVRPAEGPDGFAVARRLRCQSSLPIVFLAVTPSVDDRLAGFDAGADDFVDRPFSMAELLARVRVLLRRAGQTGSDTWQVGDLLIDEGGHSAIRGDRVLELTRTEFKLLSVVARHPGRVLSKEQLIDHVWGMPDYNGLNLIEVHLSSLRRKLEAAGPRIIHTVRGVGYVLRICSPEKPIAFQRGVAV